MRKRDGDSGNGSLDRASVYRICTDKGRFDINPAFDIILEVQRLYKEESLTDYEKIQQALSMLVRNRWNLRLLKPAEQLKLMQDITSRYIEVEKRPQIKKSPVPVLDFERDGDYIYASFMQAYQIDLIDEQGKLPWKKFLYLFNGLPADTKNQTDYADQADAGSGIQWQEFKRDTGNQ